MFNMIKNIWAHVKKVFHRNTSFPGSFLKRVLDHLWQTASVLPKEKKIKDLSSKIDFIGLVIED